MSTEQQIVSVVIGWGMIAIAAAVAYWVHWTDKRVDRERRSASSH